MIRPIISLFFSSIILCCVCLLVSGTKSESLYIDTSTQVINEGESEGGKNVLLRCIITPDIAEKIASRDIQFQFYAKNDLQAHVFELTPETLLALNPKLTPVPVKRYMLLEARWDKLFYKIPDNSPYRWQWSGKNEPPLSPLANINGEQVRKIQVWFSMKAGKKKYKSTKLAYTINP